VGVSPPLKDAPSTAAVAVALLLVYVVWGSTYLAIAVMIETLPPLLAAGVRYLVAGGLMVGAVGAHGRWRAGRDGAPRPRAGRAQWRAAFIVGTLLLLGGNGGVVLAELLIPSGVAAVLVATVPIWLALLDAIVERRAPTALVVGGLVAGIIGVAVLLVPVDGLAEIDPAGVALVVGGTIAWASGSIYARRAPLPRSGLLATGMEMVAGGASLFVAGLLIGEVGRTQVDAFSMRSLIAFAYLTLVGSIVGFTAYTWLLAHVSVSTVGTYAYVNPIVAVALGAIFLQEPITVRTVIAAILILGAVVAMLSGRPRAQERVTDATPDARPDDRGSPALPDGTEPAAGRVDG
jgi:drug/metabolite transporter (DMT)-like permease